MRKRCESGGISETPDDVTVEFGGNFGGMVEEEEVGDKLSKIFVP